MEQLVAIVPSIELAPERERADGELRVDFVRSIAAADDPRLVARARPGVAGPVGINKRHAMAGGVEMMSGPGAKDAGTNDNGMRHRGFVTAVCGTTHCHMADGVSCPAQRQERNSRCSPALPWAHAGAVRA